MLFLSESLQLFDTLFMDCGRPALINETLKKPVTSAVDIGKSTVGTSSVRFADEVQNGHLDVGSADSAQTSSEEYDSDDTDLLPAPPPTEPGILRYHGEQDMVLQLPKIVANAPVMTMGLDCDTVCEFCGSELMPSSGSESDDSTSSREEQVS